METLTTTEARDLVREPPRLPSPEVDERQQVIQKCVNQTIRVPNLLNSMPEWPSVFNPYMDEVSSRIDEWLTTIPVAQDIAVKHRQKGDYVKLSALYYAHCTKERLFTLTQFLYWVFMWDDDIDTGGELGDDRQASIACCDATKACLDTCFHPSSPSFSPAPSSRGTIAMLYPILRDLSSGLSPVTRQRFRLEMHAYIDGVMDQHTARHAEGLLDPLVHFEMRAIDIGVIPFITVHEFAMAFELPEWVRQHEAMDAIVMQASKLVVLQNEVMSIQKEFKDLQIENMCFLFVSKHGMTIQEGIGAVVRMIREHYDISRAAEARLPWSGTDERLNEAMRQYVCGSQRLATGTAHWSYLCERYVKFSQIDKDFETVLELRLR